MAQATETTTAYGFPVESIAFESYEVRRGQGHALTFYTTTLEGLVVNGKRYERVVVEYKHDASGRSGGGIGDPRVMARQDRWDGGTLTESAQRKIEEAAREHARETFETVLGTDDMRKGALRGILAEAARDEFVNDKHRGSLEYRTGYKAYPFTNGASDWRMICSAMGASLSDEEVDYKVRTTRLQCFREHIAKLEEVAGELED